jgi:nucleoside recognition membrane protein YjiH
MIFQQSGNNTATNDSILDTPFAKAVLGCVIGAISGALLAGAIQAAALLIFEITVPLALIVIAGCLVAGVGMALDFGNLVPKR